MKKILSVSVILSAIMLILPLSALSKTENALKTTQILENAPFDFNTEGTSFKVCHTENGEITEIKTSDYIFGVVAAEMPALYEKEALKAQAVAAYTFALNRKSENKNKSYDITDNHITDQSFITEKAAREKWGEKADEYVEKIKSAISDTENEVITYNGSPITAVYHAISSGKTETAENVWGMAIPYLVSVSSEGDKLASGYISEKSFTEAELTKLLSESMEISAIKKSDFSNITRSKSGTILKIKVCGKEMTGARLRSILDLRSSNFEITYKDDKFVFKTYGYGHSVGMSQNGANYMAKQGKNYKEILKHYYKDCKIENFK